jgi:hypothetical protein
MSEIPTVSYAPAERATTWMNWRYGQWIIVLSGTGVLGLISVLARTTTLPDGPLLLVGLTSFVSGLVLARRPIGGEYLDERVPLYVRRLLRRSRRELQTHNPLPLVGTTGDGFDSVELHAGAPATLQGLRFLAALDNRGRLFGVVHDTVCDGYSAVMRVEGQNSALADGAEIESVTQVWGQVLASLGTASSSVRRLQLLEVAAPDVDGTDLFRYYAQRATGTGNGVADASYRQLLAQAGPTSTVHETFLSLQISPDRARRSGRSRPARDAAMTKQLVAEMAQFARVLHRYGIRVIDPLLGPRELARAIRYAFDPGARVDVARRDDKVDQESLGVSLHGAWPLSTDHRDPHVYRTDSAYHATFWVEAWPERPVAATFLQPLLLNARATRRFCVVFNPLTKAGELQAAQERMVLSESGEQLRREKQFMTTEQTARRDDATRQLVQEIADHEAPFTFSGWVAVSSPSVEQLAEDCDEVLDAASESFLELRRMHGVHDVTFTYLLPGVCRGLRGWN